MFTVYKHTSPSGKVYVGITSQRVEKRWNSGYGYQCNDHFWKAIQKYGWKNFKHEIIAVELSKEDAFIMEAKLISEYKSNNPNYGYNLSSGGESPGSHVPCSDEKKEKIRRTRLGEKHWFYGKHLTLEHRQKISAACKGKTTTNETKVKQQQIATKLRGKAVRCVETDVIYSSTAEAARATNTQRTGIIHVLRGERKTHGGYHWEYVG